MLGETEDGVKTTRSSPEILPDTVVYDPDLTLGTPTAITLTSAVNAMAHAVEATYSAESNPVIDGMALQAIRGITGALPIVIGDPGHRDGRAELLQSAWLAGMCMASVGMGLHHKLCHVLGGTFALPHAPTHTVILPHVMAYNRPAVPEAMRRIADAMQVPDAAAECMIWSRRSVGRPRCRNWDSSVMTCNERRNWPRPTPIRTRAWSLGTPL